MTDLLSRANVNIAINTLLNDLQPNDAIQPSDHNGLLGSILDTLANGLSTTLRTGNTTGGFSIDVTDGDTIKYNKGGSFVGVLDSLTLTGSRSWDFPDNSGTIALLSDITGGDNISSANLTFDGSHYADLSSFSWTLGGTAPIGAEKISLQKDTLIKGSNNSENTSGFKVTDSNNLDLLDVKNNGQIGYGGAYLTTTAHAFNNPNNESKIASFLNNDGSVSVEVGATGRFSAYQNGTTQKFFDLLYIGSVPVFSMYSGTNKVVDLKSGSTSFFDITGLNIGSNSSANSKALLQLSPSSGSIYFQKFFANITMTSSGRTTSSSSFGTPEKGFECFDTTLNKKCVWNGSAWEEITSTLI